MYKKETNLLCPICGSPLVTKYNYATKEAYMGCSKSGCFFRLGGHAKYEEYDLQGRIMEGKCKCCGSPLVVTNGPNGLYARCFNCNYDHRPATRFGNAKVKENKEEILNMIKEYRNRNQAPVQKKNLKESTPELSNNKRTHETPVQLKLDLNQENSPKRFPKGKPVLCVDTNKMYSSLVEAALDYNIDKTGIYNCCTGKQKTAGGVHWVYPGVVPENNNSNDNNRKDKPRSRFRKVLCVETGVEYPSTVEAAKAVNGCQPSIYRCCSSKNKTAYGFHWQFVDESIQVAEKVSNNVSKVETNGRRSKRVTCIETGEVFNSINSAAKIKHVTYSCIYYCCNGRLESAGGLHWKFTDENNNKIKEEVMTSPSLKLPTSKKENTFISKIKNFLGKFNKSKSVNNTELSDIVNY